MSSRIWSPPEGTSAETLSPSRLSYGSGSDSQRFSSDGADSTAHTRRLNVSPSPSYYNDDVEDEYDERNSIDEVDATLNNFDDDYGDTERSHTPWSPRSYSSSGPTFSSATGTFTYSGSYRGSPSFVSLPTFSPRSPLEQSFDQNPRLSRITERTEESLPSSTGISRSDNPRRSAFIAGGTTSLHSRSSTEPGTGRTLPAPGRLGELIAVFESQSPSTTHTRATTSTPGRSSSPIVSSSQAPTTSYIHTSYGYGSRPSSPSKLRFGSSPSPPDQNQSSALFSTPVRPSTGGFRTSNGIRSDETPSYTSHSYTTPSYTATPSPFSNTITQTGSYTTPNTDMKTITGSEVTYTRSSASVLRKPQSPPRSPIASVRNIVALWKERTPASVRVDKSSASPASPPTTSSPISQDDGSHALRRGVQGARARVRGSRELGASRPVSQEIPDTASIRSGAFPPGFDLSEFSTYARSNEPPTHIGLLWYLNVHASPPYRWQKCQALLYPHVLLLSWLAPGGGRGIVALDLLNCTSVQSAPLPSHPLARDDVGTIAARQHSSEPNGLPLMEMLVPFQMMYADGVERLAAESLLERQKWVNRIWEAVNRPINVSDSVSVTRSPTASIRTILTIESDASHTSTGSRSTVFVPPLSSIPDISDLHSSPGLTRRSSIVSSLHSRTVDDTVIQNQDYVYPGDRRVISPSRGSLKRNGSTTDLDDEFRKAISRARGLGGSVGSPVTVTSGSSLGKTILMPLPPSGGRVSSDEDRFLSASSNSNVSSTYFSPTATVSGSRSFTEFTPATSATYIPPSSTFASAYLQEESGSDVSFAASPSTLSRVRVIRQRVASRARSASSGYQTEISRSSSDQEHETSESRTPTGSYGSYTPGSGTVSFSASGSYLGSRSRTPTGSYTDSYSGSQRSRSRTGSESGSGNGDLPGGYTPGSGSFAVSNVSDDTGHGIVDHTPISSSETGYDICLSSDVTRSTFTTTTVTTVTPTPLSPILSIPVPVIPPETYVTASLASTEYDTAPVLSTKASVTSFESLQTIPSEYWSAPSISSYRTASEPPKSPPLSIYDTAGDIESIPDIPTPKLSSIGIPELDRFPIRVPSVIPTIRSPESFISDLEPMDIPLPASVPSRSPAPLPQIEVPQLPQPLPVAREPIPYPLPPISHPISHVPFPPVVSHPLPPLPIAEPLQPQSSATPSTPTPVTAMSTPRPRVEQDLPPLPPSLSPSLSPSPSPLSPSMPEGDVGTPTSIQLPPLTTESSVTEDLSLLSSLPPSTLGSTSIITPTSLLMVSSSAISSLPPPPRPAPLTRASSASLSISSVTLSTFTESSSPVPPSPQPWATATDISYDSSVLRPSPSVRSVALPEGMEVSFETSILRPTGSPSSVGRMSTIPPSPVTLTTTPYSPLPPLTPVPALPPSLSSMTDIETPTTLDFTAESSSISVSRTLSISSSSYSSESSLTPSTLELEDESPIELSSLSTEPSLLSTVQPPSDHPSTLDVPVVSIPTPDGTLIVSVTTPQGSGATEQSSLRTIPSTVSAVTQRDLARDLDRLADEIRLYDQARGIEHEDLADNIRALRDELRHLADYLRRSPSPRTPVIIRRSPPLRAASPGVPMPPRIQLVDRPAGDSTVLSPIFPGIVEVIVPAPASSLLRSSSHASSVQSYLTSHHSDDDLLEMALDTPMPSPGVWEGPPSESIAEITSSSSISSSPVTPSSELVSEVTTTMPQAPEALERALRGLQDQLNALENGQNNVLNLLEGLQRQPEDHTPELTDRLQRIENLIQTLLERGHPRGPEIPLAPPSPTRTGSISGSTDSLQRLRSILRDLAAPDMETRMPLPIAATGGPSIAQQLDDILSATHVPATTTTDLPRVQPFVYRPADRGIRARSISPVSMEIPRSRTVPLVLPVPVRSSMRPPREQTEPELRRDEPQQHVFADASRPQEQERPDRFHVGPGPTPQPVFPTTRPSTAPVDIGAQGPTASSSWYRPPKASTSAPPVGAPDTAGTGVRYMPMPAGPTVVQLPPIFDSLMEILRENRLAQLATVDQQRELMRYMRGLNEWLERDVRDRQNEIQGVYDRVDQLSRDLRDLAARARRPPSTPSSSDETETAIRYNFPVGPPPPPFPGPPHGFQPFPIDQGHVIPPVIPDQRPAQPTIILQQPGQVLPGAVPPIPRLDYHPGGPGPRPPSRVPTEAFIPPSRASTGTPLPTLPITTPALVHTYPSSMGPNVVPYPESTPSSESPSTPSRRPTRRRRDSTPSHLTYESRTPTPISRLEPRPLTVTNGPDFSFVPGPQPGPPVHVISPSSGSSSPQRQPTIIVNQPPQHIPGQTLYPGQSPYPVTDLGLPIHAPTVPIPISEYGTATPMPIQTPIPMQPIQAGFPIVGQPYPVSGVPTVGQPYMVPGVPTVGQYPPPGVPGYPIGGPPVIVQGSSPRSSPSPTRRRSTPPPIVPIVTQPQPPIIIDRPPVTAIPTMQAGYPMGLQAPMAAPPVIISRPDSRSSRSRSRSPDRPPIIMQPGMQPMYPPGATYPGAPYPGAMFPPAVTPAVLPTVLPGAPAPILIPSRYSPRSRSRSRSRSPRHPAPIILQTDPHGGRRRSYSYSPSYSPRYRRRSPLHDRDRYGSERDRPYRRYGRRDYSPRDESYSPPRRRRRPRSSDASRSPRSPRSPPYYAPALPFAPITQPLPSHYYARRSPPHIEVIDIPQSARRRERSPSPVRPLPREHERSPTRDRHGYERSPARDHRERYTRRHHSVSPPYTRSPSFSPPRARLRPVQGPDEDAGGRRGEDAGGRRGEDAGGRRGEDAGGGRGEDARAEIPLRRPVTASPTRTAITLPTRRPTPEVSPTRSRTLSPQPEEVTRPPIRIVVPSPTSRPPRGHRPQTAVSTPPGSPRGESEVPYPVRPRRSDADPISEAPLATGPPGALGREGTADRPPASIFGYPPIEDPREQIEALNHAVDRLQTTVASAAEAEDRREDEYRQREDERMQLFLDREAERNEEARERAESIWRDLEERLATLPPIPTIKEKPEPEAEAERSEIEPTEPVPEQPLTRAADDIKDMIRSARDDFAKEHERLTNDRATFFDELREAKDSIIEEKDNRIRALEDELQVLQSERQQSLMEEADQREQERQERLADNNSLRKQIDDLTNLVQGCQSMIDKMNDEKTAAYEEKQARRQDKDAETLEQRDMIQKIHEDLDEIREKCDKSEDRDTILEELQKQNEELQRQNAEQRALLQSLSDSWRADCQKHHEEILEAVQSTADKQVPFNVQGYLDEFSQALAAEVRMLLGEVGKIREERRALQHEIGDLLSIRSKYGPGGEYEPDWRPSGPPPPPPETGGPAAGPGPDDPPPGGMPPRPAWRTVYPKPSRKKKKETGPSTSTPAPQHPQHLMPPPHGYGDVRQQLARSWDTWQPDRNAVTPPSVEATLAIPGRQSPGLFGPRTPSTNSNSMYERR